MSRESSRTACNCTDAEDSLWGVDESEDIFGGFVGRFKYRSPKI